MCATIYIQMKLKTEAKSVAMVVFSPLSMFLFLPFQQSQCFAPGKFTEQLRITYLTDNVSSVVSKNKQKKKVLVHTRLKPMQCEIRGHHETNRTKHRRGDTTLP